MSLMERYILFFPSKSLSRSLFFTSIAISSRHLRYFEPKPFICKHQVLLYLTKSNLYGANVYLLSDFCVFHVCHDSNLIESSYFIMCTITTLSDPCFSHCSPPWVKSTLQKRNHVYSSIFFLSSNQVCFLFLFLPTRLHILHGI